MISTNDLRPGMTIIFNDDISEVIEFQHVKPGKGGAFVRTKLKNLRTGRVLDNTFKGDQKVEQAIITKKKLEFLYRDTSLFHFMDQETYEQLAVDAEKLKPMEGFLKDNEMVDFVLHNDTIISIALPDFVTLRVKETSPGLRGDTATGASKPATLETGATVQVPLFINEGDLLRIDTRSGEYMERVAN